MTRRIHEGRAAAGILAAISRHAIHHPARMVVAGVLAALLLAPGIPRLRLRTDGKALVPAADPAIHLDRAVRADFGVADRIVVLVRSRDPGGIFNQATIALIRQVTDSLAREPAIDPASIASLATEKSDRFIPRTLELYGLLDPPPTTPADLARLRADLGAIGLYHGTLLSNDERAAAILAALRPGVDRTAAVAGLTARLEAVAERSNHEIDVVGAPVAEALLGSHILSDLGVPERFLGARPRRATAGAATHAPIGSALARVRALVTERIGLAPLAVAAIALVFWMAFGSLAAVLLPLGEVLACLLFVFGLMGLAGVPIYLTITVLPVLLVTIGITDEIHVFAAYARRRAERPAEAIADSVAATMAEMNHPVFTTAVTTAIGFLSFAVSPLPPVRAFGLFAAAGVLFCLGWTLAVIPALLVLLRPRGFRPSGAGRGARARWIVRAGGLAVAAHRHPRAALAVIAIAILVAPLGWRRLVIQDSWIDGFAPESSFRQATAALNAGFAGAHILLLRLDAGRFEQDGWVPGERLDHHAIRLPGAAFPDMRALAGCSLGIAIRPGEGNRSLPPSWRPDRWSSCVESAERTGDEVILYTPRRHGSPRFLLDPAPGDTLRYALRARRFTEPRILAATARFEEFLRAQTALRVGGVLGPPDYLATTEFLVQRRAPGSRRIPDDQDRIAWLFTQYGRVRGEDRLREIVTPDWSRGLVTVFLRDANFRDTARLLDEVQSYAGRHLAPAGIEVACAGDVAVSQALVGGIVTTQVRSLLASLLGIFAVTALLLRSLSWGGACVLPAAAAVAFTFAFMGLAGVTLGVATSMFAAMTLGIGVDFAIHLIAGYRRAAASGLARDRAIAGAVAATGPAILVDALAVGLGFGILILSQVPANARLGAMTVVCLLGCVTATLLLIPALLRLTLDRRPAAPETKAGAAG